jgi:propanol-preferring alcohol dehydrogenase
MRAMVLEDVRSALVPRERDNPAPGPQEVLVEIAACGVCRTDLHVVDGELPSPKLPVVPGHEIVGRVAALGSKVAGLALGERIGVPWLGFTCAECEYCRAGCENCATARYSPGIRATAALPPMRLQTGATAFRLPSQWTMLKLRHFCVRA